MRRAEVAAALRACVIAFALLPVLGACGTSGEASDRSRATADSLAALASGPEGVRRAQLLSYYADLSLGDPPQRFRAEVWRNNGRVDTLDVPVLSVDDTSVARVVDGAVEAVEVGDAALRLGLPSGLVARGRVMVVERVFADSVWLARGEVRAWELRPGWYKITVEAEAPAGEAQPLELAADLICVPERREAKETITCRVTKPTRVLLRHTGVGSRNAAAPAVVTIVRMRR